MNSFIIFKVCLFEWFSIKADHGFNGIQIPTKLLHLHNGVFFNPSYVFNDKHKKCTLLYGETLH